MKAEIICIGDELLLGQITDTNSPWIAQKLNKINVPTVHISTVSDTEESIFSALKQAGERADLIIVTGGLGPTRDDVTKHTAAKFFNTTLVKDSEILIHVKGIFSKFGHEMPAINYSQADVLACSEPLFNKVGTAPGMWVEENKKIYIFLPGVPFEMKYLIENEVIPRVKKRHIAETWLHEYILTIGIGESSLAEKIEDIELGLPKNISLAYLPKIGMVRLRLSGHSTNAAQLQKQLNDVKNQLSLRLGEAIVAFDDISLEEVLIRRFQKSKHTLSTAESCTGGKIAADLVQYSGASKMFLGSVVAYANKVKSEVLNVSEETLKNFGAVSEETVIEMAKGAKALSHSDYAIATSGIAGPEGGTDEKPVGTVWIAIAGKRSIKTKLFHFKNNREINIERTATHALLLLWQLFKEENENDM